VTPHEARARFVDARVAYLATADAFGTPHIVPVTFAIEADTIMTAIDGKAKAAGPMRRVANVQANPAVSLLVDGYDEDWTRLWWARADGRAAIARPGAMLEHALGLLRARYPQYRETPLDGPAIIVRVDRWSGWVAAT
jgi:PPOX class probable F420-dependent enzyme